MFLKYNCWDLWLYKLLVWLILQVTIVQKEIKGHSMSCFIRRRMAWNTGMSPCSDLLDPSWKWRVKQSIFLDQSLTLLSLLLEELRHLHNLCKTLGRCMRLYSELYCWLTVFCFLFKMNFCSGGFATEIMIPTLCATALGCLQLNLLYGENIPSKRIWEILKLHENLF